MEGVSCMEKDELNEKITALANETWDAEKRPILLSQLGAHDRGEITRVAKVYANSLSKYIDTELQDKIRLVRHTQNPVVVGIVPKGPETDSISNFDSVFERRFKSKNQQEMPIRFHPIFWRAFKRSSETGHKRFLITGDRLEFLDISDSDEPPDNAIEIEIQFLSDPTKVASDEEIFKKIEAWADLHELRPNQFSFGAVARKFSELKGQDSRSLLNHLLNALDQDDLKRISLPMDIVRKLTLTKL